MGLSFVFEVKRRAVFLMTRGSEFQSLGEEKLEVLHSMVLRQERRREDTDLPLQRKSYFGCF